MMLFVKLFYEFFKVGLFAVGGGMATVPFLYDMSDATGWFTYDELTNMIAVGESTPGPIGVNMATYVGYITGMDAGGVASALLGAVVATLGLVAPSIVVILIIAVFLKNFRNNPYVNGAFYGLRPASTGLIAAAGLGVAVSNFSSEIYLCKVCRLQLSIGRDGFWRSFYGFSPTESKKSRVFIQSFLSLLRQLLASYFLWNRDRNLLAYRMNKTTVMQLIKRVVLFYVCDDALKSGDLSGADFVKQEHKEIQGEVLC